VITIRTRHALACALLALAGGAQALEVIEENDPAPRNLATKVSDAQRRADLRFADCLKANGGKMTDRCIAIREQGAKTDATSLPAAVPPAPAAEPAAEAAPPK
jgi:hypothetical protein